MRMAWVYVYLLQMCTQFCGEPMLTEARPAVKVVDIRKKRNAFFEPVG